MKKGAYMLSINTVMESERMIFQIPDIPLGREVLAFYIRNRSHLEPWEPSREPNFYTLRYQELLLEANLKEFIRGRSLRFWLREKTTGNLVGAVNLNQIIREPFQSCLLGYKMDSQCTGKGLMTEAVSKIASIAFDGCGLHRIEASVIPRNQASRRVLLKNGFSLEGFSPRYLRINGRWEDHERYALLNGKISD